MSREALALDTNRLLLLVVGRADPRLVSMHRRLRRFALRQLDRLVAIVRDVDAFDRVGLADLGLLTPAERGTEVFTVDAELAREGELRRLPISNVTRITDPTR